MKQRKIFLLGIPYPKNILKIALLHIPVGLIAVAIAAVGYLKQYPTLGLGVMVIFTLGFFLYEILELIKLNMAQGWEKAQDYAYPELAGFCGGTVIGYIILYIIL